jgi:P4 family phage/plasmid primase-like protien
MKGRVEMEMELKIIKQKLKELLSKDIIEQELEINKISEETGITKSTLSKQLQEYKKETRQEESEDKNVVVGELSKKIGEALNKKELAEKIIDMQPIYYDRSKNWWLWNCYETRWELTDETDILNAIERQASINTINSKEKNEILEALKQVSRLNKPGEVKPTWIQFKNTIVDIETGKEFRAMPDWFITNPIPYKLNENRYMLTPIMDRIFEEWVGKENVQKLYEIIAYSLLPDYPIHRIFCFIGSGMNGKSKYLELLRKFIGTKNCCTTELDTLLTSRFEVSRLYKKLVCQMGETNFNEMKNTSTLKKLSGGDLIGYEFKGKDPFEDKNYAKIIISTNNLPTTTDKTIGFYRRWMIIDFPNQFSEAKDIISEIPEEEYECLAVKCIYILNDLLKERKFTNEGDIEKRIKDYEDRSNPLGKFIKENTIEDLGGFIFKWEFEKRLNDFCKENKFREMSEISIGKKMKDLGFVQSERQTIFNGETKRWRAWIGISWKDFNQKLNENIHPTGSTGSTGDFS